MIYLGSMLPLSVIGRTYGSDLDAALVIGLVTGPLLVTGALEVRRAWFAALMLPILTCAAVPYTTDPEGSTELLNDVRSGVIAFTFVLVTCVWVAALPHLRRLWMAHLRGDAGLAASRAEPD